MAARIQALFGQDQADARGVVLELPGVGIEGAGLVRRPSATWPAPSTNGRFQARRSRSQKLRESLVSAQIAGEVYQGSFLGADASRLTSYDAVVGNPPFLRFQFIASADLDALPEIEREIERPLGRVGNLWIPIFISSLLRLKQGGAFSFILPSEFLTGISAHVAREWLSHHSSSLRIDLFPPRSFPGVLQEIIIVSGRRVAYHDACSVEIVDNELGTREVKSIDASLRTWTALTLPTIDLTALHAALALPSIERLGDVAQVGVSTVTGANDFFTLSDDTRERYELHPWTRQLVSRARHAPGLRFTAEDWRIARDRGEPVWLLDVDLDWDDVVLHEGLRAYLTAGAERQLHERYKCRIRSPWYAVPAVRPKPLLLSKRSHHFPRLISNEVGALTTDTIYQGTTIARYEGHDAALVASFHNSLTLLTAEIEGRSFGGGVLELVPSEIMRLRVIDPRVVSRGPDSVDAIARINGYESDSLITVTNELVARSVPGLSRELLDCLEDARRILLSRRLSRN